VKKVKINKKFIALALASTMTLAGCISTSEQEVVALQSSNAETHVEATIENKTTNNEYKQQEIVTKEDLNIREEPNTNSKIIDTVKPNTHLTGLYNDGEWYKVLYNNETAYVKSEYVYEIVDKNGKSLESELTNVDDLQIKTTTCVQATESVNIRSDATKDSNSLGVLGEGQILETNKLLDNGWYEVIYNGKTAYVKGNYVKEIKEERIVSPFNKIVMFDHESNLYSYNDKNEVIDTVPTYEVAYVYKEEDDKYIAQVNNKLCYVNTSDVSDIDDKIVIVDVSDQHATLYNGNEVIVDTPIVSGTKESMPTDIGYFDIDSKTEKTYLVGPGYKSFVDYWMPFNGDEGLHDAEYHVDYDENGNVIKEHGWRTYSEFGGNTYEYSGSHGCVNLPNEAAKKIYDNVDIGTKVLVKK